MGQNLNLNDSRDRVTPGGRAAAMVDTALLV